MMGNLGHLPIPQGPLVLVTGANGFLGSHITDQFLQHGYRVRGAVRSPEKHAWLSDIFQVKYGTGRFELCRVPDMTGEKAFDEAIKGVSIVVHTASVMTLDPDPNKVVPNVIAGALNVLRAAHNEQSVKRFIYTSSSAAVYSPFEATGTIATEDTWNEAAVEETWKDLPPTPERGMTVYAASKTQAEQEVWRFAKEHRHERPEFVLNTVVPAVNLGKPLDPARQGYPSTSGFIPLLWKGETFPMYPFFPRQYFVDVQDTARLHVAAAILSHVKDERIFAYSGKFSWDAVLAILRKAEPDRGFPDDFSGGNDPNEIYPRNRAEELLHTLGRPGWTSLEDSVTDNMEGL